MQTRYVSSLIVAAALTLGMSGCTFITPQSTTNEYDPSDGIGGGVGDIQVRNAVLISDNGVTANLVVTLVNRGTTAHNVEIQYQTSAGRVNQNFEVGAEKSLSLGEPGGPLFVFRDVNLVPGGLFPVFFQYGNETGIELLVPVLTSQLPEYNHLAPDNVAPPTPSTTPTESPSPDNED